MLIINNMYTFIKKLSLRDFQRYSLVLLVFILLVIIGTTIQLYRSSHALKKKIVTLNEEREERIKHILTQGAKIKNQQKEMDRILSEDLDFKIAGYFTAVLKKLGILTKKITETATQNDIDALYRESTLTVRLEDMNMKELTELLQIFENNKRVSIKRLDIIKSTKKLNTLEIELVLTTMLLKTFSEL